MTNEEIMAVLKKMSYSKEGMNDVINLVWNPKFDNDTYSLICRRLIATVIAGYNTGD
jgi:hypothetical protein